MGIIELHYDLGIDDHGFIHDQIRDQCANLNGIEKDGVCLLLIDPVFSFLNSKTIARSYNFSSSPGFSLFKITIAAPIMSSVGFSWSINYPCHPCTERSDIRQSVVNYFGRIFCSPKLWIPVWW